MPTVYKRCGKSLNVNKISERRHAAVRLVYNEVALARVKTEFTALQKEMNVHALNAHVRATFYAIINMEHSKDIGRVFNRFPASAITPFLNSDFLDDETHFSILTLLLRTPNKLAEFSIYASNFMTDLPLEDVIRTTMGVSATPAPSGRS